MSQITEKSLQPLSMRLPETDVSLIDRAAKRQGRSRTDFVRTAAVQAAEATLLDASLVRMSAAGFDEFARVVSEPGEVVPEMIRIMARSAPWDSPESGR